MKCLHVLSNLQVSLKFHRKEKGYNQTNREYFPASILLLGFLFKLCLSACPSVSDSVSFFLSLSLSLSLSPSLILSLSLSLLYHYPYNLWNYDRVHLLYSRSLSLFSPFPHPTSLTKLVLLNCSLAPCVLDVLRLIEITLSRKRTSTLTYMYAQTHTPALLTSVSNRCFLFKHTHNQLSCFWCVFLFL